VFGTMILGTIPTDMNLAMDFLPAVCLACPFIWATVMGVDIEILTDGMIHLIPMHIADMGLPIMEVLLEIRTTMDIQGSIVLRDMLETPVVITEIQATSEITHLLSALPEP
jgi:hypothetical protein